MKWLPGSWKSTRANKQEWYKVFSRDTVRLENPWMKEEWIKQLELEFIFQWYNKIIIDNTHMNPKSLEKITIFCINEWYSTEICDMFDMMWCDERQYLEKSIKQNKLREKVVPNSVIYQMYLQNYGRRKKYIICDIDWTIANLDHRLHYIKNKPKDHEAFYSSVWQDLPIQQTIDIINSFYWQYDIVLMSWRRNWCCEDTEHWLAKHWVKYDYLLMRNSFDFRDDVDVKRDLYNFCLKYKYVYFVIDDRKRVVDLWKEIGLYTIDVRQTSEEF